uniref:Group II intron maturase-specific domain-containing protein n=1 Tax=Renouxia sp. TaxID=2485823 RepID=A0A3G3MIE2_9FLOR|nr:hypothetical protein [Renouxia sp.]
MILKLGELFSLCKDIIYIMGNNNNKWDIIKDVKEALYCSEQENGIKKKKNLRSLEAFKKEILFKFKKLKFLLLENIKKTTWPILKYKKNICILISLRKRYLVLLSKKYGPQSIQVEKQICSWISSLDMRIYAITIIYKIRYRFIYDVNKLFLSEKNLLVFLSWLKINNLLNYSTNFKNEKFELQKIFNVNDYAIQILFVQILQPIMNIDYLVKDLKVDYKLSWNIDKNFFLDLKSKNTFDELFNFFVSKMLIGVINEIYTDTSCEWLTETLPFPKKLKGVLSNWLGVLMCFQIRKCMMYILSRDIISLLILNFILKKLKEFVYLERGNVKVGTYIYWVLNKSWIVYSKNKFIIYDFITFDKDVELIVKRFCLIYGFKISYVKYDYNDWKIDRKLNFLNFIICYSNTKLCRLKEDRCFLDKFLCMCSFEKYIIIFKNRIKNILRSNLNLSPYQLICLLNPIIKEWNNYFYFEKLEKLLKLDYFIWFRTWKYLKRKFKKIPIRVLFRKFYKVVKIAGLRIWQFRGNQKSFTMYISLFCELNRSLLLKSTFKTQKNYRI